MGKFIARLDVDVDCEYVYLSAGNRWRCLLGGYFRKRGQRDPLCDFDKGKKQRLWDMCEMLAKPVGWRGK